MTVAESHVWVDLEAAIREWARTAGLTVGGRVFFGKAKAELPQIVLARLGGTDGDAFIQFDVWGSTKADAADAAADLATAIDALDRYTTDDGTVSLLGAVVDGVRWLPEPDTDRPRYIVDATFVAVPADLGS